MVKEFPNTSQFRCRKPASSLHVIASLQTPWTRIVCKLVYPRAPDKRGIEDNSKIFFSYFSMTTYVVTRL